jgi:hypothetical protein
MSSGQTLMAIGALILLSVVILSGNRRMNDNEEYLLKTRFGLEATAIATSLIEEASQLAFDEQSWDTTKIEKVPSDFTLPYYLGPDAGETGFDTFDDFDDFNKWGKTDTTQQNIYKILCTVGYVDAGPTAVNLDSYSSSRTLYKKLDVTITSPITNDTLELSYIHGFWFFN